MQFRHRGREFDIEFHKAADDFLRRVMSDAGTFYELDLLEYMRRVGLPEGIAVDVGANIGNHALYFATFVAGEVIAVEPNPAILPVLERNLSRNGVNSMIVPLALGEEKSRGEIVMPPGSDQNPGMAMVSVAESGAVEITTLDGLLAGRRVAFIKVDVEGGELSVLKGATRTLKEHKPHLFLEAATPSAFAALRDFLAQFGYTPIARWAVTPVYHFVHRPSLALRLRAKWLRFLYVFQQKMRRIAPKVRSLKANRNEVRA